MTDENLVQAIRCIAETPKQGEPEPGDPQYTQVWDEDLGKHAIEALHDQIDLARRALNEAGIAFDQPAPAVVD